MQEIIYTFQLSIEQDRESIAEVSIGASDTPESIAKAKATILNILNRYTPGSVAKENTTMQEIIYTFRFSIEQNRESIVDISTGVSDTPESIAKAKTTILHILNKYTPGSEAKEPPADIPASDSAAQSVGKITEAFQETHKDCWGSFRKPNGEKASVTLQESEKIAIENGGTGGNLTSGSTGTKGFILAVCGKCGHIFRSFLREPQKSLSCKCGGIIDLTIPLARFEYICKSCGKKHWGKTNFEDASIDVHCSCGKWATLDWDTKEKMYRPTEKHSNDTPDTAEDWHDQDAPDVSEEQETPDTPNSRDETPEKESGEDLSGGVE